MPPRKQPDTFATRLRVLRQQAGWSAYRLAQESGVSKQTLSKIEQGQSLPGLDVLCKLADALHVPLDAFRPA